MADQLLPDDLDAYLKGDASPDRRRRIEAWLRADPSHSELFFRLLDAHERRHLWFDVHTDDELRRLETRLHGPQAAEPAQPIVRPLYRRRWWVAAAASITLVLVAAYAFRAEILYQQYRASFGQRERITLADGSLVELNANSSLRVSRFSNWQSKREVFLAGEAFFTVTHTLDNRPFTVQLSNKTQIQVLGTEFAVRDRRNATKVILKRGSVRLTYRQREQVRQQTMKPGDWVELTEKGTVQAGRTAQPEQLMAWRSHQFVFDRTPLAQVVRQLTDQFGVRVTITDQAIAERTISGVIDARTADELLRALERVIPIRIDRRQQQVIISPKP